MGDKSRCGNHGWYKFFFARRVFYFKLEKVSKSLLKSWLADM
jgi:hypothetical protein